MAHQASGIILRRMTQRAAPAAVDSPLTTSRAIRLALVKAAQDSCGLALNVASTGEEMGALDQVLGGLDPDLMLVGLRRSGVLAGFVGLDGPLRDAIVQVQTMGRLAAHAAPPRVATLTDKLMCDPVLGVFLAGLPAAVAGTGYDGWVSDLVLADLWLDARRAALQLPDLPFRVLRMSIDLTGTDRQGALVLALPIMRAPAPPPAPMPLAVDWAAQFGAVVQDAPTCLMARLHRFSLPLSQVQGWQVGQVLPLLGCNVNSVRLVALDGRVVAQAKLGQLAGKRALRIEAEAGLTLVDLAAPNSYTAPAMASASAPSAPVPIHVPIQAPRQIGLDRAPLRSDDDLTTGGEGG